jgi:hypothetical protein
MSTPRLVPEHGARLPAAAARRDEPHEIRGVQAVDAEEEHMPREQPPGDAVSAGGGCEHVSGRLDEWCAGVP